MTTQTVALYPPLNFGYIQDHLFRSAIPNEINFQFLHTLQLKTILILSPEVVDAQLVGFMEDFDITPIYIRNTNSQMLKISPVTEDTVIKSLQILLDQSRYPILITCEHGRTLTGAVIGCLRKLQRWSMISIFDEYRRYARTRLEQQHEQFIELFDTDLVCITQDSPNFLQPFRKSTANGVEVTDV